MFTVDDHMAGAGSPFTGNLESTLSIEGGENSPPASSSANDPGLDANGNPKAKSAFWKVAPFVIVLLIVFGFLKYAKR